VASDGRAVYCAYRDPPGALVCVNGTVQAWTQPELGRMAPTATLDPGLGLYAGTLYCGYRSAASDGVR